SRSFVNDQPVSAGLLRRLAATLVEIHGQFETHGLFDTSTHRAILDAHGGLASQAEAVRLAWCEWVEAESERARLAAGADNVRTEESYLRDALAELDQLDPK